MHTEVPEEFIDWLCTAEEMIEFKGVPEKIKVPLTATRLRGKAAAWWQQFELTRSRLGKTKVTSWEKMKKHLCAMFLPYNYQRLMYQRLQNLRQEARSVEDYTTKLYQLISRNKVHEIKDQLMA